MTNLLLLGFLPSGSEWIIIALVILLLFGGMVYGLKVIGRIFAI